MSRKGISASEKTARLLAFFHDSQSFFALKDLEKQAAKATGINSMQIKDILQGLMDDDLVRCEKIGSGNFYWSFPSDARRARENAVKTISKRIEQSKETIKLLETNMISETNARTPSDEREHLVSEVHLQKAELERIQKSISKFSDYDPELIELQKQAIVIAKEAINRWTDNIYTVIGYFREQGVDVKLIYQEFNIPEDLDSI
ncbi:meiotic nuclear division protein 1 [Lipomyces japonicus]|uniref:meiotic nuclear division protein 1 n=1 Tax=Lipomyces japonicus TaxID=56871 RepID=UPI0034CFDEB7